MEGDEKVTVRLSPETVACLFELVALNRYPSQAEAVRSAVESLIDANFTPEEKAEILAKAEAREEVDIDSLTSGGNSREILSSVISRGLESERKE